MRARPHALTHSRTHAFTHAHSHTLVPVYMIHAPGHRYNLLGPVLVGQWQSGIISWEDHRAALHHSFVAFLLSAATPRPAVNFEETSVLFPVSLFFHSVYPAPFPPSSLFPCLPLLFLAFSLLFSCFFIVLLSPVDEECRGTEQRTRAILFVFLLVQCKLNPFLFAFSSALPAIQHPPSGMAMHGLAL